MFWEGAMFLRVVRAAGAKGVKNEYVRVVEAYRENGKTRHRTVLNLGRRDLLAAHLDLDKLRRLLQGDADRAMADRAIRREDIGALAAWDWGPMLVAGHLWRELGLEATLDKLAAPARREATRLSDRTLVLVVNRLTAPGSEHGLARWLETDFVCDRCGRRWLAAWRDDGERLASRTPRVRVELRQLKTWYRTLDQLLEHKDTIEHALFFRLRDLFSLQVDMVFYDLTSTYFEGHGPPGIGANGHSRDGKPRNPQVLVGLVVVDGWPIAHHVFAGNRRDAKTVPEVLRDLEQRFGLRRIVFVGDRGMVTSRQGKAQSPREGRCRGGARARAQSWPSLLRLVLRGRRVPFFPASGPLRPRAGLRGQIRHPGRRGQSVRGRSGAPLQRAFRRRTLLRQPQGRHRHAADLSSHRGTRRSAHLRRRARLPAPSRYREEAQGGADRSLRNRSLDDAPINPRRRYRPRQRHHQTRRHRSYPTRRGRAARHRHQRSRPAHPANPRPNRDVVTKQKSTATKSKSYSRKRETWARLRKPLNSAKRPGAKWEIERACPRCSQDGGRGAKRRPRGLRLLRWSSAGTRRWRPGEARYGRRRSARPSPRGMPWLDVYCP